VPYRADAAYSGSDGGDFAVVAAAQHRFEEAGRFDYMEPGFLYLAVFNVDDYIAVSFYSCYMF
jgi:hypothetical protein